MKNPGSSAHIPLHLAKHHSATLMNCTNTQREKAMKMAKFCEDHIDFDYTMHELWEQLCFSVYQSTINKIYAIL